MRRYLLIPLHTWSERESDANSVLLVKPEAAEEKLEKWFGVRV